MYGLLVLTRLARDGLEDDVHALLAYAWHRARGGGSERDVTHKLNASRNEWDNRVRGWWTTIQDSAQMYPISGLLYYISRPHSMGAVVEDPLCMLVYLAFILTA